MSCFFASLGVKNFVSKKLSIKVEIKGNVYDETFDADYVVSRAFKREKYDYNFEDSITNKDSKIIIVNIKK